MVLIARRSLHDVYSTLLPLCYWQRVANFYLFAVPSAITVWFLLLTGWTPSFSLLAPHRSPLISSMLTTCHCLLPAGSSRPNFCFFSVFDSSLDQSQQAPRGLFWRFAACNSLLETRFLVAQCRLFAIVYNTCLFMFTARDWTLKPCF